MKDVVSYMVGGNAERSVELLAEHLAGWVAEETGKNLVFHTFSNTGWLTYGVLLEKFRQQDPSLLGNIKGCIVDSAPVAAPDPQVWASGFSAAFLKKQSVATKGSLSSTKAGIGTRATAESRVEQKPAVLEAALLAVLEKFFGVVLNLPAINRRLSDVLDLLSSEQPNCPQLYIYSSADKVIPAKSVESFIEQQRKAGQEVRACDFMNSPHVDHFRNHPSLYASQLTAFLEDCVITCCKDSLGGEPGRRYKVTPPPVGFGASRGGSGSEEEESVVGSSSEGGSLGGAGVGRRVAGASAGGSFGAGLLLGGRVEPPVLQFVGEGGEIASLEAKRESVGGVRVVGKRSMAAGSGGVEAVVLDAGFAGGGLDGDSVFVLPSVAGGLDLSSRRVANSSSPYLDCRNAAHLITSSAAGRPPPVRRNAEGVVGSSGEGWWEEGSFPPLVGAALVESVVHSVSPGRSPVSKGGAAETGLIAQRGGLRMERSRSVDDIPMPLIEPVARGALAGSSGMQSLSMMSVRRGEAAVHSGAVPVPAVVTVPSRVVAKALAPAVALGRQQAGDSVVGEGILAKDSGVSSFQILGSGSMRAGGSEVLSHVLANHKGGASADGSNAQGMHSSSPSMAGIPLSPAVRAQAVEGQNLQPVPVRQSYSKMAAGKASKLTYRTPEVRGERLTAVPPLEVSLRGRQAWAHCLVGYVLDKRLPFTAIDYVARMLWKRWGLIEAMASDNGFYFFKFSDDQGLEHVLGEGNWMF